MCILANDVGGISRLIGFMEFSTLYEKELLASAKAATHISIYQPYMQSFLSLSELHLPACR